MTAADKRSFLLRTALYPCAFLYAASGMELLYSDFAIIKTAFLLYAFVSALEHIAGLPENNRDALDGTPNSDKGAARSDRSAAKPFVGICILALAASIALLYSRLAPAHIISISLIFACAITVAVQFAVSKTGKRAQSLEHGIILIIGAIVANLSVSYTSQLFGVLILCIHLSIKIFTTVRENISSATEQRERLFALENKFSQKVEFRARRISMEMEDRVEEIEERSMRDPLTKISNRTMIGKKVQELISESSTRIFSVAIMDLDNFKTINDTLGHVTGDKCLQNMAELIMKNKTRPDIFGRFGGDEFIIILPGIGADEALKQMDYHRKYIEENSNPHITTTIGVAVYPKDGRTLDALVEFADKSLYKAKELGKNCVAYAGE